MKRIYYNWTDSGDKVGYLSGELRRFRFVPGTYDTGINSIVLVLSPDEADTGDGKVILSIADTGAAQFALEGSIEDTGGDWWSGAGDKLTAKIGYKGTTGATSAEMWVYFSENE